MDDFKATTEDMADIISAVELLAPNDAYQGIHALVRRMLARHAKQRREACGRGDDQGKAPRPDRPTMAAVIVSALRERRPGLPLPTAQLEAETILLRLQEAGWLPPVPIGWPPPSDG